LKKAPAKQLFFDFRGAQVGNITVNGTAIPNEEGVTFRNHKVYLPTESFTIGEDKNNIVR